MRAAQIYAAKFQWRVVPLHDVSCGACSCSKGAECRSSGKHPRVSDWVNEATNDPDEIAAWIAQWPRANVGVATGAASGFFVLDVDPDKGGAESLAALTAQHGPLPETVQALTGSGGAHYLFALPDFAVSNSGSSVGKGLDIRGDGGQIVVAPSRSLKGGYVWVRAPWEHAILPAPAWLLAALGRAPAAAPTADRPDDTRGYFPPASPEVLEQARQALEQHGPGPDRVNGEGGGMHAVQAAALLTHDFALSEQEAWPLLVEWNDSRATPFDLDDLRSRLFKGQRYGKSEYGCRRTLDMVETARRAIRDWQVSQAGEPAMWPMIERVRVFAQQCGDPAKRETIENELGTATGLTPRALALPKVRIQAAPLKQGEIQMTPDLHEVADKALTAIAPLLFQRNGVLCEVARTGDRTFIHELTAARIQDVMSQASRFVRVDMEKGAVIQQAAPERVATILQARRGHPEVRILESVTNAPIFLSDGTILQERGYNEQARVFLEPNVTVDIPDHPTQDDARQAVAVFREVLQGFNFASPADFSAWVAALLSPLVKAATANAPTPLICVSAASPGAGKTLLVDTIAQIVTGADKAEIRGYNPRDDGEWAKKLTTFVKMASPISVFDNCNGAIGDEGLERLITSSTWSDRLLGASDAPPLPNVSTWFATGNNIEPVGDTVRRVLMCRIDVKDDNPQQRTGFKYDLESGYALRHRADLLSGALTILRAYHVAGRPAQSLPSWGSFTAWSHLVRGALVWAGCADPYETQRRATEELHESEHDAHDFWISVVRESDGTVPSVVVAANARNAREALGAREDITAFHLKRFLGRFVDKPRQGYRIRKGRNDAGSAVYRVEQIT